MTTTMVSRLDDDAADPTDDLTQQERDAGFDVDQLKQLVGLVAYDEAKDVFPVTGWDAIVFVVGNATQTAHYYQAAWGMRLVAYRGPETGFRDHKSYVLESGSIRFVVCGAVNPESQHADHHRRHGDGVIDIALEVPDVDRCIAQAKRAGATVLEEPHDESDEHGTIRTAAIATYGDTRHTLVQRVVGGRALRRPLQARVRRVDLDRGSPRGPAEAAVPGSRPHRRQRRARPDGRVGRLLQPGHGLREHGRVRRRGHRHRLLRADVQGRGQR